MYFVFFFFNDTATTEIYTLSLHDALPIWARRGRTLRLVGVHRPLLGAEPRGAALLQAVGRHLRGGGGGGFWNGGDRKSTRLNSSHANISYAVFCLKKKKKQHPPTC